MGAQQRLVGIDVFRGLAIFAVIVLHIDEGLEKVSPAWTKIADFALFCVPFFLATAFFLAVHKLYNSPQQYPLQTRFVRLLIPYAAWSAFYLLYKSAKYIIDGEFANLLVLFQDPISVIFFGGASYHLYFLPLLAVGTFLIKPAEFCIRQKISIKLISLATFISLIVYEVVLVSGNGLRTPENIAFEPFLLTLYPDGNFNSFWRLLLVNFFWIIRCLPYILVAMLLAHPTVEKHYLHLRIKFPLGVVAFFILNIFGTLFLPAAIYELVQGYTALMAAIALSSVLKEHPLLRSISLCSFGIYLIHIFFIEIFQSVAVRLYPEYMNGVSTVVLLTASVGVFLVSWVTTIFLRKNKMLSQVM